VLLTACKKTDHTALSNVSHHTICTSVLIAAPWLQQLPIHGSSSLTEARDILISLQKNNAFPNMTSPPAQAKTFASPCTGEITCLSLFHFISFQDSGQCIYSGEDIRHYLKTLRKSAERHKICCKHPRTGFTRSGRDSSRSRDYNSSLSAVMTCDRTIISAAWTSARS
jgi:hypothetical protein